MDDVDRSEVLKLALHLACGEFIGPDRLQSKDEDALAIRFIYEGLSASDALDLSVLYAYGKEYGYGSPPPMPDDFQAWLDDPPRREMTQGERDAIRDMRADLKQIRAVIEAEIARRDAE